MYQDLSFFKFALNNTILALSAVLTGV